VRFRWTYGLAAVGAMFHDVVLLLGVFAWLGKELDGVFIAALLTVIGYSVNDSVVVFDRIRELRRGRQRESLREVANDACLQTIPRTVNTGLGALFILVALYLLGGETLRDFALALLVGIVVGTYSSVFTATPLAVRLEGLSTDRRTGRPGLGGRTAPSAPLPSPRSERASERAAEVLIPASPSASASAPAATPRRAVTPAVRTAVAPPRPTAVPPRPRKKRRKPTRRR
jgi:SecD/SecF fusion protein